MNYKAAREAVELTLAQVAQASGYSIATINGLENHDDGSDRLRKRLVEIYAVVASHRDYGAEQAGRHARAASEELDGVWKVRALRAEKALAEANRKLEAIQRALKP